MNIAAVIPTRNRSALAIAAVRSLQEQDCPVEIFVSDNSSSPDYALRDLCRSSGVHYLRPPRELFSATHWDWAIRQALERSEATHFTVHYDRKITKPRHLGMVQALAARWPDLLITWLTDYVSDLPPPLRLCQAPWTGNVYELRTARLVELTAAGRASVISSYAMPLLSNCLVPRGILSEVVERFGDLCDSTSPDSCFTYRFCTLRERYLHFDRAMGVLYAPDRSTGGGYARGHGGDWEDFRGLWRGPSWLAHAPVPGLNLGLNMLYHEYERVRRAAGGQFPPLDRTQCLNDIATALVLVENRRTRAALRRVLEQHGWNGGTTKRGRWSRLRAFLRDRVFVFAALDSAIRPLYADAQMFRDDEEAVRHALAHPRPPGGDAAHLTALEPVQVTAG